MGDMGEESQQSQQEEEQAGGHKTQRKIALSRRQFLILSAVVGVGVVGTGLGIGIELYRHRHSPLEPSDIPSVWLLIAADNTVTIRVAKAEMGQGVLTALAQIVAEELDVDWSSVRVEQAMADTHFGNQVTDGSASIATSYDFLRALGAEARALLVAAAAKRWGVDASTCSTAHGMVLHPRSGRRIPYGDLPASVLAQQLPASEVHLKAPAQFQIIGASAPRVDTPAKVDGSATFGLDVRVPGMLYATVARCPVPGGTLASFDATAARAVAGVRDVTTIPSGVAVVAEHTWAAMQGRNALQISWNNGANASLESGALQHELRTQAQQLAAEQAHATGATTMTAMYETPYLAHAAMEPMNCTADVRADRCTVWVGTQDPQGAQQVAANESGLPVSAVSVHVPFLGGGFGRRTAQNWVAEAVQLSKHMSKPVQVVWTREDDIQQDAYRPASCHQMRAVLDASGAPQAWQHSIAAQQINPLTTGAALPYAIASAQAQGSALNAGVPVSIWRSIEYSNNIFAIESFLDELAIKANRDPVQLRLDLLRHQPRLRAVVQLAAEKAGWGTPLPAGWGRGIAACLYQAPATFVAEVAEVSLAADGTIQVQRVVCAVDCGRVINPNQAQAQIEGGVIYGLSAALYGEITYARGAVQQSNFHDYRVLRINETPAIEVYFILSTEAPSGLGEPAVPPIAPAVANAIAAASGKRIRRLPLQMEVSAQA